MFICFLISLTLMSLYILLNAIWKERKKERENISLSKALLLLYLIASGNNKWFTFFKKTYQKHWPEPKQRVVSSCWLIAKKGPYRTGSPTCLIFDLYIYTCSCHRPNYGHLNAFYQFFTRMNYMYVSTTTSSALFCLHHLELEIPYLQCFELYMLCYCD